MGWGRTLLLGDIGNRLDIADTEEGIKRLQRELNQSAQRDMTQDQKLDWLVRENNELKLYLASLVRLMTTKGQITTAELEAMVAAIDAEDGQADGKFTGDIV